MSVEMEEVTRCDKCGNTPSMDVSIKHYECGHDVCSNHRGNQMKPGYVHAHVREMCPICNPPRKEP